MCSISERWMKHRKLSFYSINIVMYWKVWYINRPNSVNFVMTKVHNYFYTLHVHIKFPGFLPVFIYFFAFSRVFPGREKYFSFSRFFPGFPDAWEPWGQFLCSILSRILLFNMLRKLLFNTFHIPKHMFCVMLHVFFWNM